MMKYKAALFDLDGTLLDSLEDMANSINCMLAEKGYEARSLDEVRSFVGNGVKKLVQRSLPPHCSEEESEVCLTCFKSHYGEKMQDKTKPYAGIIEALCELKRLGVPMAIISNKYDDAVKKLTKEMFGQLIDIAIGTSAKIQPKPAVDGICLALEMLGVNPAQALYFGDSEVDVLTAQNAKMDCVGVAWGFREKKVLQECGANYIITEPDEIVDFFIAP